MSKITKILLALVALLIIVVIALGKHSRSLQEENKRLEANSDALMEQVCTWVDYADRSAASVAKLELEKSDLEKHYADVCKRADDLGLQVKRLQATSKTATETVVEIQTEVKDSIVYQAGVLDTIKAIEWRDPWISVSGTIQEKDLNLAVASVDTLYQYVYRVPHKFWFIKWGCKGIRQVISSSNPHTKIVYSEYIELKK